MTGADDVRAAMGLAGRSPAMAVRCTHCGAQEGEECHGRTAKTRTQRRKTHPARLLAAAEPRAQVIPFPTRHPPPDRA